tara:strand:+ start:266 stop:610 length:345 start_codon:yes stop_codon:yes gene_type:complete
MSEDRLQSEVIKYINYQYPKIRYCGSAGGVFTGITQARKMVRTGYVKGFPDLFIYEAKNGFHGLAIEIKTIKGRATKEQKEWIDDLNDRGYKAKICKGLPEILDVIDKYLNEKD